MYDFAVVGLGPTGAHFARRAAEDGYSVLGLERGEIGRPLACSGHVSRDIWQFLPEDGPDDLRQNEVRGARFHLGGPDSTAYPFYKSRPISNVIDRVGLDRRLAAEAESAGVDIRTKTKVTAVEERPAGVRLTTVESGSEAESMARMVVGADGPHSTVRRELGLPEPDEYLQGVLAHVNEPDAGDFVDVHLTVPTFFAWRIPRGEAGVEFGLAAQPGDTVHSRLDALLGEYGVGADERFAGAIPIGPPDRTTASRGLLLGDAAGQTKPFTGGGILYGLRAAEIAAETVEPRDPKTLSAYESAWRSELEAEIVLGSWIRRAYSLPRVLQRVGLSVFSGEIGVHMDEPTSLFSREQLNALFGR